MNIDPLSDAKIIDSWSKNAAPWTVAVREKQIESRKLVTDRAIAEAILSRFPGSVLDLGCGEGWLIRDLDARNISGIGVDAISSLIDVAQQAGGGDFYVASYEEISQGKLKLSADVVVCNFSLLGEASVTELFKAIPNFLNPNGSFIVQTLHPTVACGDLPYRDGWRLGSWSGFNDDFIDPAPWYFRILSSWIELFIESGFKLLEMREPIHPLTQKPASVIFIAEIAN